MTRKSWEIPPAPLAGDATNTQTFAAVGNALSSWEYFEAYLAMLYANLVGGNQNEGFAAMRSYGTIVSFQNRRKMLESAVEVHFAVYPDKELQDKLADILTTAEKLSARRNEIAHGIVQPYAPDLEPDVPSFALFPAYYATNKRKLREQDLALQLTTAQFVYSSAEIDKFAVAFSALVEPTLQVITAVLSRKRAPKR
jgi:hypothetical protein